MPSPKDNNSLAARMQAHMDAVMANTQSITSDPHHPSLSARFLEEAHQIIGTLDQILTISRNAAAATDALLARCKETGLTNSTYAQAQEYWFQLADTVYKLEQLLWIYCDESWFNRSSLTKELTCRKDLMGDSIEILIRSDFALIRMPHIPATKKRSYTFAEELLWAKLFMQKDLPQWNVCHATFCHVYPTAISQMPKDIDNYDYKRTIDILSYYFGFSDCPESFSMTMESMLSDELPSGTYISLEPELPKKLQNYLKTQAPRKTGNE